MISNVSANILQSPVGRAILARFGLADDDISLISDLISELTKDGKKVSIKDILDDPLVGKLVEHYNNHRTCDNNVPIGDNLVKCPSCGYMSKLNEFAPKLK